MAEGPQALTTKRFAVQTETTGTRGTTPTVYIIAGGKGTLNSTKASEKREIVGNRDPVLSYRKPEECKLSLPLPPLIESNGLGEMLLYTFGTDTTSAEIGSSTAYDHVFTANDTVKTFTTWAYDTLKTLDARLCTIDQMKIEIDREKGIDFTFDIKGADVATSTTFGEASYVNVATDKPKLIPSGQCILEWGNPQSAISQYWKKITFTSKENVKYGAPGKAPVPSGSSSAKLVVKGKREFSIDIDFIDTDGIELKRWRQGGDTIPTATAQADVQALTGMRLRAFGNQTKASTAYPWYYAHRANVGAVTITMGGTYTAGLSNTPAFYEIYCTTDGTPDKFKWRKNGGTWSAEVEVTAGAMTTLGDGLEITFSSTSGMSLNDTYYVFSHAQRMIEVTSLYNVIDEVTEKDSSDFYESTLKAFYEGGPSSTKPSATLRNTRSTAYS